MGPPRIVRTPATRARHWAAELAATCVPGCRFTSSYCAAMSTVGDTLIAHLKSVCGLLVIPRIVLDKLLEQPGMWASHVRGANGCCAGTRARKDLLGQAFAASMTRSKNGYRWSSFRRDCSRPEPRFLFAAPHHKGNRVISLSDLSPFA